MLRDLWAAIVANPLYKLLSVVLALSAWLYVQSDTVVEAKIRIPVIWVVPDGLGTVDDLPGTATVTVRGARIAMRNAEEAEASMDFDLTELGQGVHQLDLLPDAVEGLPAGVEVVEVSPASLRVTLDELVHRRVALRPERVGEPAPGFRIEQIHVDPSVVELRGPRALLKAIDDVPIAPVDVSGMATDAIVDVQVQLPRSVTLAEPVATRASVQVVPELEQRTLSAVPVSMWRQPGWRSEVDMVEVTLEGPSEWMRRLTSEDVVAFVHLPDKPTRDRYEATVGPERGLRVRILHPGGESVRVVSMEPMSISVRER